MSVPPAPAPGLLTAAAPDIDGRPTPPHSVARSRPTTSSFTLLTRRVHELGMMRRRYGYYWTKLIGSVAVLAGWTAGFVLIGDTWWQLVSAAVLAVILTQIAFLGHDAAHRQIFNSGRWNDWISLIVATLLVGISYGWWRSKHNRHHANPNKVGVDPDIGAAAVAFTPERATRHQSRPMRWVVAHQGWYFFPLLMLEGASLHWDGVRRVLSRGRMERRWVEITFLALRFGGLGSLAFWVLSPGKAVTFLAVELAIFGFYLGFSFAPNHVGMPLVSPKLKLDFLSRQVLMSRNITGGRVMAIFMGGLNYQVEHHLFPSMARPHLRKIQPLVAAYCVDNGIPYTQTSLWSAYRSVVRYLNTVGLNGRDPFLCPLVASRRFIGADEPPPPAAASRRSPSVERLG